MKSLFLIVFLSFVVVSCSKIEPEKKSETKEVSINQTSSWEVTGVNLDADYWVNLEEESKITERFRVISEPQTEYGEFLRSPQYKDFVEYVHEVFAKYKWLEWDYEKELTYIFDVLIPKVVMNNWVINWKMSDIEAELMIQSIKRKEFNSLEHKKLITERFKIYMEEKNYNPFIKSLTAEKISEMKKDEKVLVKNLLDPYNGIIYLVLKNRYDWNKTGIWYKPAELEWELAKYLNDKMMSTFSLLGYDDERVQELVFAEYKIDSLEWLAELIKKDYNDLVLKYGLSTKMPLDREYRNDEQNDIFKDRSTVDNYISVLSDWNNKEFESDLSKLRIKMYLVSYFGKDRLDLDETQWLWSSRARAEFIDPKNGDWIQNLFRLSRYMTWEEIEISFDNKF